MDNGSGGRSRRHEFGEETNASSAGLTLGGILSIKQTPPYRIQARTLLDLIRDDQTCGRESKKTWKMFREKLRLKLAGSGCTTTAPAILASHVQINSGYSTESNRMTTESSTSTGVISISPLVNVNVNVNDASSVPDTQSGNVQQTEVQSLQDLQVAERDGIALTEEGGGGGGGGPTAARMSLMSLLEGDGYAYLDDNEEEDAAEEEEEEDDVAAVVGGGGGGGGEYKYNNCCVCMVRHKGAAFIPCGHTFCRLCSRELFVKRASCPLCNHFILEILDIF